MKCLAEYEEKIHSCSKCGLCQSVCPIYKITGNDCTVSRGQFIMLRGVVKGDLKMSKTINQYLDLCLKCNACSKFCPAGIDVVDIIASAKAEFFQHSFWAKLKYFILKHIILGLGLKIVNIFSPKKKSQKFDKKVIYFGGCGGKLEGNKEIVTLLNSMGIEVITPDFDCCGIPFFTEGDFSSFEQYMKSFFEKLEQTGVTEIVTTCASCEKTIKSYKKWCENKEYTVKNIFEYIKEQNLSLELKNPIKVTFHKPCNLANFEDIEWILNNTKNLEYVQMKDFDKCCGLNGISKLKEYKIMKNLYKEKHKNIINTGAKTVLTSCLGCEKVLKLFSFGKYKVYDLTKFLCRNIKQ